MKKIFLLTIFILIIASALIFVFKSCSKSEKSSANKKSNISRKCTTNNERINFIKNYGWEVESEPLEESLVIIPSRFSDTMDNYNEMLKKSGFDLENYKGSEVVRFSYKLTNHPLDQKYARVNLYIYKNQVIACDVMSTKLGGFMHAIDKHDLSDEDINN